MSSSLMTQLKRCKFIFWKLNLIFYDYEKLKIYIKWESCLKVKRMWFDNGSEYGNKESKKLYLNMRFNGEDSFWTLLRKIKLLKR